MHSLTLGLGDTYWIEGWVGSRDGLDMVSKKQLQLVTVS